VGPSSDVEVADSVATREIERPKAAQSSAQGDRPPPRLRVHSRAGASQLRTAPRRPPTYAPVRGVRLSDWSVAPVRRVFSRRAPLARLSVDERRLPEDLGQRTRHLVRERSLREGVRHASRRRFERRQRRRQLGLMGLIPLQLRDPERFVDRRPVSLGELLIGVGLVLGLFTGLAATDERREAASKLSELRALRLVDRCERLPRAAIPRCATCSELWGLGRRGFTEVNTVCSAH